MISSYSRCISGSSSYSDVEPLRVWRVTGDDADAVRTVVWDASDLPAGEFPSEAFGSTAIAGEN